jgi:hypothetical protein
MTETKHVTLVVTSIAEPSPILTALARGARKNGMTFIVIGDAASPPEFRLEDCRFYDLAQQRKLDFTFAGLCPTRHYARKNIGYLIALSEGAEIIIETDDDNIPRPGFWNARNRCQQLPVVAGTGWLNAYRYFTDVHIWPRGLPLEHVHTLGPDFDDLPRTNIDCPIQQGLADENPDVDAIYRLLMPLPQNFRADRRVALARGAWSPFNSQNTTWWRDVAALLYLPATCSFRMTDIWRSFVAQRIAWENDWGVLFHEATVRQERNDHNLSRDFRDEVRGYLGNAAIAEMLDGLRLEKGVANISANMRICYEVLLRMGVIGKGELQLLDAWLGDLRAIFAEDRKVRRPAKRMQGVAA